MTQIDTNEVRRQADVIAKGANEVIAREELEAKIARSLETKRPLVAKLGADPSAPDLHLGHTVVLTKLRQIQDLGHQVVFLIGDFTGRIGDPTGRSETRKPLTEDEVKANAETYCRQIFKILDRERTRIVFNSEWLSKLDFAGVLSLCAKYTVARLLERDDFSKRFKSGLPIGVHELMYPLMQGYDSVALAADLELGGTDQKFNLLVGRELQRAHGQEPQVTVTMPILEGLDGVQKMSKSLGNYVGINEPPKDIFGKLMSVSDDMMFRYYLLLTDTTPDQVEAMRKGVAEGRHHPMELKTELAYQLTARFHCADLARAARDEFRKVVREKGVPESMPELAIASIEAEEIWVVHLFQHAFGSEHSSGKIRRLISQGGLKIDQQKVTDEQLKLLRRDLKPGTVLQLGKHNYVRLV